MDHRISRLFRANLPAPAPMPFDGFPRYNFVGGHNDGDSIPVADLIAASTRSLQSEGRNLATYGLLSGPQGYRPLREFVASRLAETAGMADGPDEILLLTGSMQALNLVNDLLLSPGDVVIVEEATYAGAMVLIKRAGAFCRGVRLDDQGIDMTHLQELLSEQRAAGNPVKCVYTIPTVQNPTGGVMTTDRRKKLLELAAEYDFIVFEDDCYAELLWDGSRPPAIRALAREMGLSDRVIYCGSFSKSIAPALRVGYLVADWPVLAQILPLKFDAGSGALEQMVLADFCAKHFADHVDQMRKVLLAKCRTIVEALEENFGSVAEFQAPRGGIFIWVTLPQEVDTSKLAELAIEHGVAINPGAEWTADGDANRHRLRLCFGHPDPATIRDGIAKLADICHDAFGVPVRSGNIAR